MTQHCDTCCHHAVVMNLLTIVISFQPIIAFQPQIDKDIALFAHPSTDEYIYTKEKSMQWSGHGLLLYNMHAYSYVLTYMQLLQRLSIEVTLHQMKRMNSLYMFQDTSPHPMKNHCFVINTLDEIIINKLYCIACVKEIL